MKAPITSAQAMSHPAVVETINALGQIADELRAERDALKQANSDLARASIIQEGYQLVPIKPTEAMCNAGGHVNSEWLNDNAPIGERRYVMPMEGVYGAMLAAAAGPTLGEKP